MADLDDKPRDRRVQMHVLVTVDMVERQLGRGKGRELRTDFRRELTPRRGRKVEAETGAHHVRVKPAVRTDQRRHLGRRQYRRAIREHQMQPDAEPWQPPRARDCIGGSRFTDHQAGDGENAVPVRFFDCLVDGDIAAEIIGANDQLSLAEQQKSPPRRRSGPMPQPHEKRINGSRPSPG
jgi:hypothetical protein